MSVLLLPFCLLLVFSSVAFAGQNIVWEATEAKAAPSFDQEKLVHVFKARNSGLDPIRIKAVKTSCGCAVGRISKNVLQGGESTELTVEIDVTRIGNDSIKFVTVQTDEPGLGGYQLAVSISRPPLFHPDVNLIQLEAAHIPYEKRITFTRSAEAPKNTKLLRAISSDPGLFEVTLEDAAPESGTQTVKLKALKANHTVRKPIDLIIECNGRIINSRAKVVCAAK